MAAAVIALSIASSQGSAPRVTNFPESGDLIALSRGSRTSEDVARSVTLAARGADQTAGSTVLPTALSPAESRPGNLASPWPQPGLLSVTRTLGVAPESGGEADYNEGGTNALGYSPTATSAPAVQLPLERLGTRLDSTIGTVTRGCAQRGLAYRCLDTALVKLLDRRPLSTQADRGRSALPGASAQRGCPGARKALRFYISRYHEWRAKMGAEREANGSHPERVSSSCPHVRYLAALWQRKARAARRAFEAWFERTYEKWRCIHENEGAWNNRDTSGNGYYGGLQMTRWFQQTYGPEFYRRWGTADRWPVYAQLLAAERAWRECRCFRQWGTAGGCGLR